MRVELDRASVWRVPAVLRSRLCRAMSLIIKNYFGKPGGRVGMAQQGLACKAWPDKNSGNFKHGWGSVPCLIPTLFET
jgi:hypothetical protein